MLVLLVAGASVWLLAAQSKRHVVNAGFWFEGVTFDDSEVEADRLGGGVTAAEMARIEAVAFSELRAAFAGVRIAFSTSRAATYRVRVVQTLRHPTFPRSIPPAGESRGIWPLGGQGAVNFRLLASYAVAHAPSGTPRAEIIDAIGRGVGRARVRAPDARQQGHSSRQGRAELRVLDRRSEGAVLRPDALGRCVADAPETAGSYGVADSGFA
ncbi:MAG: hypothetical protein ACRD26_02030 [Vicinamibacterales bacterium]